MPSDLSILFDPTALAVVIAGTLIATFARSGWNDVKEALRAIVRLHHHSFDADANRAALAQTVSAIARDGPLRAEVPQAPDPLIAKLVDIYLRQRSPAAMHSAHRAARAKRDIARMQAVRTMEHAGELGPVFGLVGTLFAITQLSPGDAGALGNTMGAVAGAAVSTLYGVLTAHMLWIPLARAIEREGEYEETQRERLIEWLDIQFEEIDLPSTVSAKSPPLRDIA